MNIDKKLLRMFLFVLSLGWFYSGATWLLLDAFSIINIDNNNPLDIFI